MGKRFLNGLVTGAGFVAIVAVAYAIAWAGDIFTVDKDGAKKFVVSDAGKITVGATESYVNLVVQNDEVVAEADNKVDITADVLTVEGIRLENVAVSANIESAGVGGLDTGSEASGTWYYVWVITNIAGTSTNGLLSTSSTSPTLPSGFTKKRRIGAVRNDGSSNFPQFVQEGECVYYKDVGGAFRILSAGQALTFTTVSAASFAPPSSGRVVLRPILAVNHNNAAQVLFYGNIRQTGSGATGGQSAGALWTQMLGAMDSIRLDSFGVYLCNASQQIDYLINAVPSDGGGLYIDVIGYYDRI